MTIEFATVAGLARGAVHSLLDERPDCLDGTERTVTGRLAIHFDRGLTRLVDAGDYVVDIEYERSGRDVKRLQVDGRLGRKIVPDLLLHRRGFHGGDENLLVVEVKPRRSVATGAREHDQAKLSLLTGQVSRVFTDGGRYLRFTPVAGDWPVILPDDITPYRFGAWVKIVSYGAEIEWFGSLPAKVSRHESYHSVSRP